MGWRYLWELEYKSELVANFDFLCNVATIQEQYTQNKRLHQDSMAAYQTSFVRFIKKGGTKEKVLKDLIVPSLLPYQFDAKVQTAIDGMTVTEFLNGKTNVTSILTKQIEVISDSEPKFAAELRGNSPQQLPQPLWEALRKILTDKDYIKDITKLNHARSKLMGLMNERIGQDPEIDIKKLRDITVGTNLVKEGASWGSIFEAWCLNNWAKLFEDPQKKLPLVVNKGKATFYFNVTKNAEGKEISRTPAALNVITDKKRIIDCSYIVNNETLIPEGRDCNRVLVELKHTQGKLEEDTFDQF